MNSERAPFDPRKLSIDFEGRTPISTLKSEVVITPDMIDAYRHLNNVRALAIFEEERFRVIEAAGVSRNETLEKLGVNFFVGKTEVIYPAQAFEGEVLNSKTRLFPERSFLMFNQQLNRNEQTLVEANVAIFLVTATGRLVPPRDSLLNLFEKPRT